MAAVSVDGRGMSIAAAADGALAGSVEERRAQVVEGRRAREHVLVALPHLVVLRRLLGLAGLGLGTEVDGLGEPTTVAVPGDRHAEDVRPGLAKSRLHRRHL